MNNKIIHLVLLLLLVITSNQLYAQYNTSRYFPGAQSDGAFSDKVLPSFNSPTAYAFKNHVEYPEVSNDGRVNINVPIYTINDNDLQHNIGLFYTSNGILVNQKASWVGTGWNLGAGGMITRTVKDIPDDAHFFQSNVNQQPVPNASPQVLESLGWLHYINLNQGSKVSDFPDSEFLTNSRPCVTNYARWHAGDALKYLRGADYNIAYDLEPDVYTFNVNGVNFDFVFNESGVPKILGLEDYKIEYEMVNSSDVSYDSRDTSPYNASYGDGVDYKNFINKFTVTDPSGYKYIFEDKETTVAVNKKFILLRDNHNPGDDSSFLGLEQAEPEHISAWVLTKIISPIGRIMNFTYQERMVIEEPTIAQFFGYCETGDGTCFTDENRNKIQLLDDDLNTDRRTAYEIKSQYLKFIETENIIVEFIEQNSARLDSDGGHALSRVEIKSKTTNQLIDRFDFTYSYEVADNCPSDIYNSKWCHRLFLDKIDRVQQGETRTDFQFTYSNTKLPHRYSYEQDFWGYYNDNNAQSLIPTLYVYPQADGLNMYRAFPANAYGGGWTLFGADRNVDPSAIKAGMLSKIEYATGGHREYVFESNTFADYGNITEEGPSFRRGGGLRIKEIKHFDGEKTISRKYDYKKSLNGEDISSGVIFSNPVFGAATNYFRKPGTSIYSPQSLYFDVVRYCNSNTTTFQCDGDYVNSEYDVWKYYTKRATHPFNEIKDRKGNTVYYTQVTEYETGNGKTVHYFNQPETYDLHPTEVKEGISVMGNLSNVTTQTAQVGGMCRFYGDDVVDGYVGDDCSDPGQMYEVGIKRGGLNILPYPPMSRTEPSLQYERGKKNKTVVFSESGKKIQETLYEYQTFRDDDELIYGLVYRNVDGLCFIKLSQNIFHWAKYHYVTNAEAEVSRMITKRYDQDDASLFTTVTQDYFYEAHPNYSNLTKRATTTSEGELITQKLFYPFSAEVAGSPYVSNLVSAHRLTNVMGSETDQDGQLLSKNIVEYDQFESVLVDNELIPVILSSGWKNSKDGVMFQDLTQIIKRDKKGNILEYVDKTGQVISIVWGYDESYPIAKVIGSTYNNLNNWLDHFNEDLSHLRYISDLDTNESSENNLRFWLNRLRLGASNEGDAANVQIYTYTYDPLIGMTSETDSRSYTTYYGYDNFNRLLEVKDADGNILSKNEYNFKNDN